uniref:Uncharacterized protein n=1 Tax=Cacopsylla melanoneura TaxID=428564 RepID=A0A8D8LP94_9HEMI
MYTYVLSFSSSFLASFCKKHLVTLMLFLLFFSDSLSTLNSTFNKIFIRFGCAICFLFFSSFFLLVHFHLLLASLYILIRKMGLCHTHYLFTIFYMGTLQ